jgi:predicted DNA-binding transcriptional regulator YafY
MIAPARFDASQAVDRVLLTCEVLQRVTGPVSAGALAMTLEERAQRPWSKRTVLRDLQALERCGYVTSLGSGKRGATLRWQWTGSPGLRSA